MATVLQCFWRCYRARRITLGRRRIAAVDSARAEKLAKAAQRVERLRQAGAAFYIARAYRAYTVRRRLKALLYWNRVDKAVSIQAGFRGYLARRQYREIINKIGDGYIDMRYLTCFFPF